MDGTIIDERPKYRKFLIVFLLYFAGGLAAQYLFYSLHTSPTILWLPAGIALGFMVIWGFEQWISVALAQFLVTLLNPAHPGPVFIVLSIVAYTGQALFGAYALKKFRFNGALAHTRDAILLVCAGFLVTAIAPTILVWASLIIRGGDISFWTSWSWLWVGGIFGVFILTPVITSWFYSDRDDFMGLGRLRWMEAFVSMAAVMGTAYLLFWTTFLGSDAFVMIYVLFGVLFWIGFRFRPRVLVLAFFAVAALSIVGTLATHANVPTLNAQLFSDELFFILIAPIFLIMGVLVTERKFMIIALEGETQELAAAMEKLSEQDRSKNEFISIFAHELRNPLAPIASTLEYLKLNEKDPENVKAVEVADQQVRLVRRLLDDLLDVARITQKKFSLKKEVITLESIIQPAVAAVRSFYETRGHSFWFSLPDEDALLEVDGARMTQAVMNLLFNAGKYTPPGGTIELVARHEGGEVLIMVKDNGIGISAETLPFIFEPFQQASRDAAVGTGLGLGLFIAKQLVEMHGGTLDVVSPGLNKGTTFTIRLKAALRNQRSVSGESPISDTSPGKNLRILAVDDNEVAVQALQKLLSFRGHSVRIAYTASEALQAIQEELPHVVLLDIGLPGMNGYDLAREIRKNNAKISLIAITGYGQEQDRREAERAGFDYHLTKPIALADLERVFGVLIL